MKLRDVLRSMSHEETTQETFPTQLTHLFCQVNTLQFNC